MSQVTQNIGKRILKKRFRKISRDKSVQNFDSAQSAMILFDTSLPDCFQPIKEFSKFLKKEGIKTSVFGFVSQKETPQEMLLWANFEFITRKDINWIGSPRGEIAERFYKKTPDILFVISYKDILSLEFLVQLSKAKFKVGCYTDRENDLDLMINPGKKDCDASFFIEQVKHYIQLLNPSK